MKKKKKLTDEQQFELYHMLKNKEEAKKEIDRLEADNKQLMAMIIGKDVSEEREKIKARIYDNSANIIRLRKLL